LRERGGNTNFVDYCSRFHPRREDNHGCHRTIRTSIYRRHYCCIWMLAPGNENRYTLRRSHRRNRRDCHRRRTSWCSFRMTDTETCQARSQFAARCNCRSSGNCSHTHRRCIVTSDQPYGTLDRWCTAAPGWQPSLSWFHDGLSLLVLKGIKSQIELRCQNRDRFEFLMLWICQCDFSNFSLLKNIF